MYHPAYITLDDDGHVTLFWGNGSEEVEEVIIRGPQPENAKQLAAIVEDLNAWAEAHGYQVVVPACELAFTDVTLDLTYDDERNLKPSDIDDLLDDLSLAEDDF